MKVAALSSFPVARLDWADPSPVSTFIVKGTFEVDEDGRALPVTDHIAVDVAGATAADDGLPLDMVPRKAKADVVVVGSARAATPTQQIAVRVTTTAFDIAVVAAAGAETTQIPLTSHYVRRPEGDKGPVRVGATLPTVEAWPARRLPAGFDFGRFNAVPETHRTEAIPLGKKMLLGGLFDGAPLTVQLPAVAPCLFLVKQVDQGGGAGVGIPLTCDTLVIDSDGRRLILTWRGTVARPAANAHVVLGIAPYNNPPTWEDLMPRMGSAEWRDMPGEIREPAAAPAPAPVDDDHEGIVDEQTVAPLDAPPVNAAVPFAPGPAKAPPRPHQDDDALPFIGDDDDEDEGTAAAMDLEEAKRQAIAALPFQGRGPAAASPSPAMGSSIPAAPAAPPPTAATSSAPPAAAGEASPWSTGTPSSPAPASALPRPATPRSALPRPAAPLSTRPQSSLPSAPPAPAGQPGAPRSLRGGGGLRETIALDEYAAIKAALWQSDASPGEVLARFSMTPSTWREHERAQARRVARDAADGGDLGKQIRSAIQAAQRRLEAEQAQVDEESA